MKHIIHLKCIKINKYKKKKFLKNCQESNLLIHQLISYSKLKINKQIIKSKIIIKILLINNNMTLNLK